MRRAVMLLAVGVVVLASRVVAAQAPALLSVRPTSADSAVFRRAQQSVTEGKVAVARAIADSVLATSPEGSAIAVDALYWRAIWAESPELARRDLLRITLEHSRAPRAEWALLRLAQLELSRGGRSAARRHLERLALDFPDGVTRMESQYLLGRTLLEEGAIVRGCAALADARRRAAPTNVEFLNQVGYAQRACAPEVLAAETARLDSVRRDSVRADSVATEKRRTDSVAVAKKAIRTTLTPAPLGTVPAPGAPAVAAPAAPVVATTPAPPAPAPANAPNAGGWTVQLAAYQVLADAERLSAKMRTRGYDVRVTSERPYRVRIGRFATRAEALALVEKLTALQITAIVMEAERP